MKTTRQKKARKHLAFFINNYHFRRPFQVLIDGTFAFAALENRFNIREQLEKYFETQLKFLTTICIIAETEKLSSISKGVGGATQIVKQYAVHKCGHEKKPVSGAECFKSMIGKHNESRYIIATQDRDLQEILRRIPGVPIMYLHGKAPTLEAPSPATQKYAETMRGGLGMTSYEKENLKTLKLAAGMQEEENQKLRKKKRKGGPNPLSCLKKKKKPQTELSVNTKGKKSGRVKKHKKKLKVAAHIKEALAKHVS